MEMTLKIDGEWFTDFIRGLFYSEDYSYEECKLKIIDSLALHSINDEFKNELAESIVYGDKKLIGCNNFDLVDDTNFDLYKYSRIPRPKHFEIGKGVIGILTTDGVFGECKYGEHARTINFVNNCHKNIDGAIIFSISNNYSYAIIDDKYKITKHQIKWFNKNKTFLSEDQKRNIDLMINRKRFS